MTALSERMVEAAARARYAQFRAGMAEAKYNLPAWEDLPDEMQARAIDAELAPLRAALSAVPGLLLVAGVPDEMVAFRPAAPMPASAVDAENARRLGHNACRAEVLARVVEVPADD